ncbi:MAG: hypothetical protein JWN78_194 [Bacteroidota bacterium]|nr:hypothetical protein [Bacteroidota bacterium]
MKILHTITILLLLACTTYATDNLWQILPQKEINVKGQRKIIPQQYILLKLNDSLFRVLQEKTPVESSGNFVDLELPAPDGKFRSFKMVETSAMAKELADKYPDLKTYKATQLGEPGISATLDYTAAGFHTMVLDGDNTWYIEPYSNKNTGYYISYYKKFYDKPVDQKPKEVTKHKKCGKKKKSSHK